MIIKRYIDGQYLKSILSTFYDTMIRISFCDTNTLFMHDQITGLHVKTLDYKTDNMQRRINLSQQEIRDNTLPPLKDVVYLVNRKVLMKQLSLFYGVIELTIDTEDDYIRAYSPLNNIEMLLSSVTNHSKAGVYGNPTKEWNLARIISIFTGS